MERGRAFSPLQNLGRFFGNGGETILETGDRPGGPWPGMPVAVCWERSVLVLSGRGAAAVLFLKQTIASWNGGIRERHVDPQRLFTGLVPRPACGGCGGGMHPKGARWPGGGLPHEGCESWIQNVLLLCFLSNCLVLGRKSPGAAASL